MRRRSLTRVLAGVAGLLAAVSLWVFLGPAQLGGGTSYAVIVGTSMEPELHRGDFAVVREQSGYDVGDAVLYDSRELGTKVLHRIVGADGGRFTLRGDNNDFLDGERPTESQIVGKLWFHVPAVGNVTEWVRQPLHAASIVGLTALLALGGGFGLARGRRRPAAAGRSTALPASGRPGFEPQLQHTVLLSAFALAVLLAFVSFTRPTTREDVIEESAVHQGKLDYSADVARNAAYPDGRVATGEPVFLRLVPRLDVSFAYGLESSLPLDTRGRISLDARLADGRGWSRVLPLAAERPFAGATARVGGTLDLRRVQKLVGQLQALTGSGQAAYSLTLLPRVSLDGAGAAGETAFAPEIGFDLGDLRLEPNLDPASDGVSPFAPRQPVTGTATVANELALGALSLPVRTARLLALVGLAATLLLGLLALGSARQRARGSETERIRARYGHLLLPVASRPAGWARMTELADFESLVRLAEHHGRMILALEERDGSSYVVEEGGVAYRYATSPAPAELLPPLPPALPQQPEGAAEEPPEVELDVDETLVGALIPGGQGRRHGDRRSIRALANRRNRHEEW